MALPALLANENVPNALVRGLRHAGVDVTAVVETMRRASDWQVLTHAHARGLWVLTFDRDYGELVFARRVPAPPAIVYLRQSPTPPAQWVDILLPLLQRPETLAGHLVVVSGRSVRLRALPRDHA